MAWHMWAHMVHQGHERAAWIFFCSVVIVLYFSQLCWSGGGVSEEPEIVFFLGPG